MTSKKSFEADQKGELIRVLLTWKRGNPISILGKIAQSLDSNWTRRLCSLKTQGLLLPILIPSYMLSQFCCVKFMLSN